MGCLRRTSSHEGDKSHFPILPDPLTRARKMPRTGLTIMILSSASATLTWPLASGSLKSRFRCHRPPKASCACGGGSRWGVGVRTTWRLWKGVPRLLGNGLVAGLTINFPRSKLRDPERRQAARTPDQTHRRLASALMRRSLLRRKRRSRKPRRDQQPSESPGRPLWNEPAVRLDSDSGARPWRLESA
jgi:hypothetical protein